MSANLSRLTTEQINTNTLEIDTLDSLSIIRLMNEEDAKVAGAVEQALPQIAKAIDLTVAQLKRNGRLIYVGAGTSGRLGVLDASECPPTFGTPPHLVTFTMAGGERAFLKAVEGAEDHPDLGKEDLIKAELKPEDIVVAISASGRTPYCIGALQYANEVGAATVSISCNQSAEMSRYAQVAIEVEVGPEVLVGSTRLKAGTAQKMILNMISTASMIRLGKAYQNLMVDMQATNIKLQNRAIRMVVTATGVSAQEAETVLKRCNYHVKTAIVMIKTGTTVEKAQELLSESEGFVRKAILNHQHRNE
jgi:N-acetylmuramic acid 6-phosphate etherase